LASTVRVVAVRSLGAPDLSEADLFLGDPPRDTYECDHEVAGGSDRDEPFRMSIRRN
jgi:hypothetical protein